MRTFRYLIVLFIVFVFQQVHAQETSKRVLKKYHDALAFIAQQKFDAGQTLLIECIQEDADFVKAYQVLADLQRKREKYTEAIQNYQKVLLLKPDLTVLTYFSIASAELAIGKYTDAKNHFQLYLQKAPENAKQTIEKANKQLLDCDFAINAMQHPLAYVALNLGVNINTKFEEYLPALTADEKTLVFTRRVEGNEDFYTSQKENEFWKLASPLKGAINTPLNEGAQSITPDGRYLFFAGCNRADGLGRCDIYISTREGSEWSAAKNLGEPVNSSAWDSQPSIASDGNTLYFVSNRSGGYGGYDIWKSTLDKDASWTEPVNLGPNINTKYDEMSPFIHADGVTLYFSSNGWPGMGKKDIFKSILSDQQWSKPFNIGYPINTFADETSLIVSANGTHAYFSTIKNEGFGGLDIYEFKVPSDLKPNNVSYVSGKVLDKNSKSPLIAYVEVVDLKSKKVVYDNTTEPENGTFLSVMPSGGNYALYVSKKGYLYYSANFKLDTLANKPMLPFEIQIDLEQIHKNAVSILANLFFDTYKYNLLPLSVMELQKLSAFLNENKSLEIIIEGHTDSIGGDEMNKVLSLNRAKAVYEYLIQNGISAKRLSYAGYGKSQPIASNDREEGRKLNRRTSFKVLKY